MGDMEMGRLDLIESYRLAPGLLLHDEENMNCDRVRLLRVLLFGTCWLGAFYLCLLSTNAVTSCDWSKKKNQKAPCHIFHT